MQSKPKTWQNILGCALAANLAGGQAARADGGIATDGTVGGPGYFQHPQTLTGPSVTIPQDLGSTFGKNLFHSFSAFNIANGQAVTFTGDPALQNVISRVTGGTPSGIDGILNSKVGSADFYLINPSGVVFGQHAQINVPAAFHASTADQLKFQDGSVYSAANPRASTLTADAPTSFGFLASSSANNGLLKVEGARLQAKTGQTLDFVGRQISVENKARLSAADGEVRMVAVQGAGEVGVGRHAEKIQPASTATSTPTNAGDIIINNSTVSAPTRGSGKAGYIEMQADKDITIENGGAIYSWTFTSGVSDSSDAVTIAASTLTIDGRGSFYPTGIFSNAELGKGKAGDIHVTTLGLLSVLKGGEIDGSTYSEGKGGNVNVKAASIKIDGGNSSFPPTGIYSKAGTNSKGDSGNVCVTAAGRLDVVNGGTINTATNGRGEAGDVTVKARELNIFNGAFINSSAENLGNAGNVDITADKVKINGQGKSVTGINSGAGYGSIGGKSGQISLIVKKSIEIINNGRIDSATSGTGSGGGIDIKAGYVVLNGGVIDGSTYSSSGQAGSIHVIADTLKIDGETQIVGGLVFMLVHYREAKAMLGQYLLMWVR